MLQEIQFEKYNKKGADYHYKQINKFNFKNFNISVLARYQKHVNLVVNYLKNNLKNNNEIKILDIGCGDGVLLYLINKKIKKNNIKLYGVDLSEMALEVARKKLQNGFFIKTDVYNLKFEDSFFDIVISSDVIEHVNYPDKMLEEIKRVCKKNAFVAISTPIKYTKKPLDKMHFQEFFQEDFFNLMEKYFINCNLIESHNLLFKLFYEKIFKFGKYKLPIYKYIINIINILTRINLFKKERKNDNELFSYMYVTGKNN